MREALFRMTVAMMTAATGRRSLLTVFMEEEVTFLGCGN